MQRTEWQTKGEAQSSLFVREWRPESAGAKAVVVLAHGIGEHGERYEFAAERMTRANLLVTAFDHYGHGRSEGKRGHLRSLDAALKDTETVILESASRHPELPVFLYGHSMGGNIALNCAIRRKPPIRGLIVTSPWLRLAFQPPAWKERAGKMLAPLWPSLSLSTGLDPADLYRTGGPESRSVVGDPLCHTRISLRTYTDLQAAGEWALRHADRLEVPLLLMHGTADRITSWHASEQLARLLSGKCEWRAWEGGLHELHNDTEGLETIDYISDWVNRQL
jgi:Lysophospholipase